MTRRAASSGFTLIEILIALSIAALLLMLALPSFSTFLRNSEIRSTTESIANGLRVAQSEAVRRNKSVSFTLVGGGSSPSWEVKQISPNLVIQAYSQQEGGTHVNVVALPVGAVSVAFNRLGRVVPVAAGTPAIQQLTIRSSIAADARALQVDVGGSHGVRMCDPSPLLAALVPPDPRAC
jgi:type IV fimbrial biogenesis protein FimT